MPFCQLPQQTSAHLHNKQIYNETKIKLGYPREQQRTLPFDNNYTRFELLVDENNIACFEKDSVVTRTVLSGTFWLNKLILVKSRTYKIFRV